LSTPPAAWPRAVEMVRRMGWVAMTGVDRRRSIALAVVVQRDRSLIERLVANGSAATDCRHDLAEVSIIELGEN